jgi:branched-chain amino acid transport system permease protein
MRRYGFRHQNGRGFHLTVALCPKQLETKLRVARNSGMAGGSVTIFWSGVALGCMYGIIALIYNIGIAQSGVFNFAAAQVVTAGIFVYYDLHVNHAVPVWAATLAAAVLGFVLSVLTERIAIRPVRNSRFGALVTTVGASVVIEGVIYARYGANTLSVGFPAGDNAFSFLGGRIQPVDVALFVLAIVLTVVLHVLSTRTRWGLAGRAATLDPAAASLRGVNVSFVSLSSFAIAGLIAGALGPVVGPKTYVSYGLGSSLVVYAFVALTLGGMGSYIGAMIGGLVVGLIQSEVSRYLGGEYPLLVIFGVLTVVLLLRPTGLMGKRRLRMV